ncbi:T9SS-dependent M36 family metallopeptidase [Flavobacterium sp.]|uniref:T9SS-dependent M36 family metallopeptidase n=1 Tax=Flavobacterium sp. TaxID=239 RepID=UPI00375238CE
MKKIIYLTFFLFSLSGFSQNTIEKIKEYLSSNAKIKALGLTSNDINDLVIVNEFSSEFTKINNYHVKQRVNGIEIINSDSNFLMKNEEVYAGGEDFYGNISSKINTATPALQITEAFTSALSKLNAPQVNNVTLIESNGFKYKLTNGTLNQDPIKAQLVYFYTAINTLRLGWNFEFYTQDTKNLWNVVIDAVDGKILQKYDLVISCSFENDANHKHEKEVSNAFSKCFFNEKLNPTTTALAPAIGNYRVYPSNIESPNHGSRQLISTSGNITASPYGWHDTNGNDAVEYTITRGNNVYAQEDINGNNGTGASPNGTASLTFDYTYDGTGVAASTYTNAATTNLFYMNNIMHDVYYQYGFNEANKNFQQNNYGRGGTAGDSVIAEAQDGSGTNNANFATPADGGQPRMQMYLWTNGPAPTLTINSPASIAGAYSITDNGFSPGHVAVPASPGLTRNLVLYNDGTPDTSDACTAATNAAALNGNIVVIRRGSCSFAIKAKAAQNAGAVAVIIVNNVAGGAPGMSGADATITIPVVSVTQTNGEAIIAAMANGTVTVNGNLTAAAGTFVNSDGDFDNGIVAHEYGHGISTRLSGNCLGGSAEQMGEGWSDWFWLMLQIKATDNGTESKGIGTFATQQPTTGVGIRSYPYSTDRAKNPFTFASSNTQAAPHGIGSVWCTILWDLTWAYIDKYGYSADVYNGTSGNNKVMRLVLDAIKIDGCDPTYISGRDALIAADQATTGGQNYCMIWKVFAERGMGTGASSEDLLDTTDQIEDFTQPAPGPNCTLGINYFENQDMVSIYPNPSNGLVTIKIEKFSGKLNLQVIDINGRVVYTANDTDFNTEKTLNLNHLQSGMYVIKISGDDLNYIKKIILN